MEVGDLVRYVSWYGGYIGRIDDFMPNEDEDGYLETLAVVVWLNVDDCTYEKLDNLEVL